MERADSNLLVSSREPRPQLAERKRVFPPELTALVFAFVEPLEVVDRLADLRGHIYSDVWI